MSDGLFGLAEASVEQRDLVELEARLGLTDSDLTELQREACRRALDRLTAVRVMFPAAD